MSKENNNFRLLGSPVNLSYRNKKKDDRKNIRNRPRSALLNSSDTPEYQEKFKRPFSADTKDHGLSTSCFLKSFSAELETYNNTASHIKVVPPTTELLNSTKPFDYKRLKSNRELCSNASDYGSEDTYISLGTKIKTKAQLAPKSKNINQKALKYRNIAKKGRKIMENPVNVDKAKTGGYGLAITITERPPGTEEYYKDTFYQRSASPTLNNKTYESYFVHFDDDKKFNDAFMKYTSHDTQLNADNAIDVSSRRLHLTKEQLSLVEEESSQDFESIPSQNLASLSPEHSYDHKYPKKSDKGEENIVTVVGKSPNSEDNNNEHPNYLDTVLNESKTYTSFYTDFHLNNFDSYTNRFSSTIINTDSSSKDSGYPESTTKDDKNYMQNYSLPSSALLKKSNSDHKLEDQPKSLDTLSSISNEKEYKKTYPMDKKWTEPLNHSRLLYKEFFLRKEGHVALPPHNSPKSTDPISSEKNFVTAEIGNENSSLEYPSYLLNSSTKAFTSKVIEDYKKEIEAINNLHELTLKDIKCDAISPTPLNIDVMFEHHSNNFEDKHESIDNSQGSSNVKSDPSIDDKNYHRINNADVSKVTTKELIQNYLKIKNDYNKDKDNAVTNTLKKYERKKNNFKIEDRSTGSKTESKIAKNILGKNTQGILKHQPEKSIFTSRTPLSARIEGVQNDKDIDSWMSLSKPSPRNINTDHKEPIENTEEIESVPADIKAKSEETQVSETPVSVIVPKPKELDTKSTVFDIYSMLKEIESYGDKPVTEVSNDNAATEVTREEDRSATPKDNFMEIFEFLEKVEQSANDALSLVTNTTPQTTPKLEVLLKLPQTELAQRLVTASLQLEERSCCIALLQESLTNHKQQMISKVSNLEKQSQRNIMKVKQECEETIKRHQNFIDQLINDKKTLNHRIEQLVDERRSMEERWKRSVQTMEERYKLELRNQHDKMAAAQQVARQRWVKQKAEKIKELTVKGLEGELREMADRQQKEVSDLKMSHAEQLGRLQTKHSSELEELRRTLEQEKEDALVKERQLGSARLEKQILELEMTYQEQRTRLVNELRAESERAVEQLAERERDQRRDMEAWKQEQEKLLEEKRKEIEKEMAAEKENIEEQMKRRRAELEEQFEQFKKDFEAEQQMVLKRKMTEISAQHKLERDREIEKAIESMETEAQAGRKELQEALRRNKEQYEAELKELAETEQATLKRYQDAQARVRHTEDRCAEMEVTIGQLETRNKILTEKNCQLEARAEEVRASCEEAWRKKVENLEKEMEDMKKRHEEQMHQLYAKVKIAVARKDSAIQALTRETAKYQEKITLLEQKLQQQRKDFLKHK